MRHDAASERQVQASDPTASTWVHANAGSGKTKVLIDRVARLLLSGVEPQHILCLTYTKAAAAEMQNRLFERLGRWAMKPDAALREELQALGDDAKTTAATMARARQLFARAIETPGGLRIQTIHSFCATLLRRFPLEAGVSPQFTELDDRTAALLRDDIAEDIGGSNEMAALAQAFSGDDFSKLLAHIVARRSLFAQPLDATACRKKLGLTDLVTLQGVLDQAFSGDCADWMPEVIDKLAKGTTTDQRAAEALRVVDFDNPSLDGLLRLEKILLSGNSTEPPFAAKVGRLPTKETRKALENRMPAFEDLMLRIEAARLQRLALATFAKTAALHAYAQLFLPLYAARKAQRGWLDFDDLIVRAHALLTDSSVAQWVLFRLDGGIDHILVDEAQDTSPLQWQVIESLAAEFTSGESARAVARTIFVVGDKKQSIYSFQGADVAAFDRMRGDFAARLRAVDQALVTLDLEYSFRSSPVILGLVDHTFEGPIRADLGGQMSHIAFHADMPGRVDLWPPEPPADKKKDGDWTDPVDILTDDHHAVRIAAKVADFIAGVVANGTQIPHKSKARLADFGDFLILVKRRSEVFHEIIRACKAKGLPIAGADRLRLGGELAVKDLSALLSFLCTDMDDLSLAAVLRSPLCGWSEAQLYDLAQPRHGLLWEALRLAQSAHPETYASLTDLRNHADFMRPYDLIERILNRHDGRRKLLERLGDEAQDGIDELLSQSLAYERGNVPSLTGFLEWLVTDDIIVKRQHDGAGDRIRVMTVHGAKGLEAPIVIMPDTADHTPPDNDTFIPMADGPAVWRPNKDDLPPVIREESEARAAKRTAESHRLLYVAMTRAQSWLVVGAAGTTKRPDSWYQIVSAGMKRAGAVPTPEGGLTLQGGVTWPSNAQKEPLCTATPVQPDPVWMRTQAPAHKPAQKVFSPSALGGAKALAGEEGQAQDIALLRGTMLHTLLETLPQHPREQWPALAKAVCDDADTFAEAIALLDSAVMAPLFRPGTLAEVGIAAPMAAGVLIGTIDRLMIEDETVTAVDFKSNRIVPKTPQDVPSGLLRQMGAYAAALRQIYPQKRVETAIVWTRSAKLMPLPEDLTNNAFLSLTNDLPT